MKKFLYFVLFLFLVVITAKILFPSIQGKTTINDKPFARLPVQADGRIKPLGTVARNSLLIISGRQSLSVNATKQIDADTWIMEVLFRPEIAHEMLVFRIDNDQLLSMMGHQQNRKYFSLNELRPHFEKIDYQARNVNKERHLQGSFDRSIIKLHDGLSLYHQLSCIMQPHHSANDYYEESYSHWLESIDYGLEALQQQQEGSDYNNKDLNNFISRAEKYLQMAKLLKVHIVPPSQFIEESLINWNNAGESLMDAIFKRSIHPIIFEYASLAPAYQDGHYLSFNKALDSIRTYQGKDGGYDRLAFEALFNNFQPFYKSIFMYLAAMILVFVSWLTHSKFLRTIAYFLIISAFLLHSFGLGSRMYIQMRPPVTNLYSSAIFVGWVAVLFGILIEKGFQNSIGSAVASIIGINTLIIGHQIGTGGEDTLEMLRAVLDSNFWLSTHVIVITIGYASVFLAGTLGIVYVTRGVLTCSLNAKVEASICNMTYAILCFALLCSFIGTMLGGIWADQSWGRFWGWDPKENGAILIVLWIAVVLHAKWARMIGNRGVMLLSIAGNIVTSWSWFGTNMLGVGLHSYGFIDRAFWALLAFVLVQFIFIGIGLIPLKFWRSTACTRTER